MIESTVNIFVLELAENEVDSSPEYGASRLVIEDNIGESVHLHYRNMRWEFTVDGFRTFANELETALEELEDGNC